MIQSETSTCEETTNETNVKLIIASHNRLFTYQVETQVHRTLHIGDGVYYSVFPSDTPNELYVSTRGNIEDAFLLLDLSKFTTKTRLVKKIPMKYSKFTHEVIRMNNELYVADTGTGSLTILSFPDFELVRRYDQIFTRMNHLNSIAPIEDGKKIYLMFHNQQNPSFVSLLDKENGQIIKKYQNIGLQGHSWIEYPKNSNTRLFLSSFEASLVLFDLTSEKREILYTSHKKQQQMFLKGLVVVNDIAYFGESEYRDRKGRETVQCSLVSFHLINKKVIFHRHLPGSIGLINTISIPNTMDSTYTATTTVSTSSSSKKEFDLVKCGNELDEESKIIQMSKKEGLAYGAFLDDVDIIRLPLQFDVALLSKEVDDLKKEYGWTVRPDVNNYFILLITKDGIPEDQSNVGPFYPVQNRLDKSPTMKNLIRSLGVIAGRTRLMMIRPGEMVKYHVDNTNHYDRLGQPSTKNGYWGRRFRIHIPIRTHPNVSFHVGNSNIHFELGGAYIFDNSKNHAVINHWNEERVHLVIDAVGGPRFFEHIYKGGQRYPIPKNIEKQFQIQIPKPMEGENSIIYERWIDSPVFVPMPVQDAKIYLDYILNDFVHEGDVAIVQDIFNSFLTVWGISPEHYDTWNDLLATAFCSKVVLKNGFSLYEALEPFERMLLFKCEKNIGPNGHVIGPLCLAKARATVS